MNIPLFFATLIFSQLICLWIARRSSTQIKEQEDYFLASKSVTLFPLIMTFIATQIGGGLVLGSCDEAFKYGWSVLFYPLGSCIGLILLGMGFGKNLYKLNLQTVAEIFEVRYKSSFLRKIAASLSIVSLFMIFVAQIIASKKFMCAVGSDSNLFFNLFWAAVVTYTAIGGLKAVISTNIFQAFSFILIFIFCLALSIKKLDLDLPNLLMQSQQISNFDLSKISGWMLMPLFFMLIEQDMGQKCFAAKSYKIVSTSTIISAISILLFSSIPIFFGILAKILGITPAPNESILMKVIQITTNPYVSSILACGILLVIVSTADALLNAIGSNLALDFPWFKKKGVKTAKLLTVLIAYTGIFFSYFFKEIVDVLIQSYEVSVSCLLVPVTMAILQKKPSLYGAIFSMLFGALCFICFKFEAFASLLICPKECLTLLVSLLGFFIGSTLKIKKIAKA
jgi:SSS family solute:Na+ symporter